MAFQDAAAPISYINCDLPVLSPPPRVPPLVGNPWLLVKCLLIASRALADCMWCVSLSNVTLPHYLFYQLKSSLFWKTSPWSRYTTFPIAFPNFTVSAPHQWLIQYFIFSAQVKPVAENMSPVYFPDIYFPIFTASAPHQWQYLHSASGRYGGRWVGKTHLSFHCFFSSKL